MTCYHTPCKSVLHLGSMVMADVEQQETAALSKKRARNGTGESSKEMSEQADGLAQEPSRRMIEGGANNGNGDDDDDDDDDDIDGVVNKNAHAIHGITSDDNSDDSDDGDDQGGADDATLEENEAAALKADLGDDIREGKRIRREGHQQSPDAASSSLTNENVSKASEAVWATFKDGDGQAGSQTGAAPAEGMVRITKTLRYGREEVTEEKLLPASHPEAKAYLAKQAKQDASATPVASGPSASSSTPISATAPSVVPANRPPPPGPRRKKGGGLAAMSAAVTGKPSKINTLEKSKLDWTRFKDSDLDEHARHELDAQTKGGSSGLSSVKGYMDRKDFLDRVQNRLGDGGGSGGRAA